MPTIQNSSILELAQNYFAQLNPIAVKIAHDIQHRKFVYGQLRPNIQTKEENHITDNILLNTDVSLQYFDKFSSSSSVSYGISTKCLIEDSPNTLFVEQGTATTDIATTKLKSSNTVGLSNLANAGFDKRNFSTVFQPKAADEIKHYEVSGFYYDEHSAPFSYKTTSQMNLHIFTGKESSESGLFTTAAGNDGKMETESVEATQRSTANFQHLQKEIRSCIYNSIENNTSVLSLNDYNKLAKKDLLKSPLKLSSSIAFTNAMYSDVHFEHQKTSNLMLPNYTILTASSSSNGTSAPDNSDDDEEKTICEDVKLLASYGNLRKGFDFLNNW